MKIRLIPFLFSLNTALFIFLFLLNLAGKICGYDPHIKDKGGNKHATGGADENRHPVKANINEKDITSEPLSEITQQARAGDTAAMLELGRRNLNGEGIPSDPTKAVHWFSLAAEKGDPYAANQLGACYDDGLGVPKNDKKAYEWYLRSVQLSSDMLKEQGDPAPLPLRVMHAVACFNIGTCLYRGEGVVKDDRAAVEYLKKAAFEFGPAKTLLEEMAASKIQPALEALALLKLPTGSNTEENRITEIRNAALEGDSQAQCQLGAMYLRGDKVDRDDQQGFEWTKKAASLGFGPAQLNLAKLYEQGRGVNRNSKESVAMLEKALANKQGEAGYLLGLRYYYGDGVEQSLDDAKNSWQKAADLGNPPSKEALAKASRVKNYEEWNREFHLEPPNVLAPALRPEPKIPRGCYIKGFVNSPDGYINLRSGPGTDRNVITKIYKGEEVFVFSIGGGEWWPCVFLPLKLTGYVHSSGVILERQGPDFEVVPH